MTLMRAPADEAEAMASLRHSVTVGLIDIATWVETNPDAEIPEEWTIQLDVPRVSHEVKVRWLRNVAAGWGTAVTEDEDGTLRTEKRSGPVRVIAAVAPQYATTTAYLDARRALRAAQAETDGAA